MSKKSRLLASMLAVGVVDHIAGLKTWDDVSKDNSNYDFRNYAVSHKAKVKAKKGKKK